MSEIKKNRFYYFRARFLIGTILAAAVSVISIFIFIKPANESVNDSYKKCSLKMNSEMDFQIPSPSKNQITALKNKGLISDSFTYYFTETTASVGKRNFDISLTLSDSMNSIDFTMYSKKRLIEYIDEKGAFIDYSFAKKSGLKVGDKFSLILAGKNVEILVARIYEDNTLLGKHSVLCEYTGTIKDIYEKSVNHLSYSGAFIKTSNIGALQNYLQNFIPEGRLRSRSEFDSDEKYKSYNDNVKRGNYSNEIVSCNSEDALIIFNDAEKESYKRVILGIVIFAVLVFVYNLILAARKSEKDYFLQIENRSDVKKYRLFAFFFELLASVISILMILNLLSFSVESYLPKNYMNFGLIPFICTSFIMYFFSFKFCLAKDNQKIDLIKEEKENKIKKAEKILKKIDSERKWDKEVIEKVAEQLGKKNRSMNFEKYFYEILEKLEFSDNKAKNSVEYLFEELSKE